MKRPLTEIGVGYIMILAEAVAMLLFIVMVVLWLGIRSGQI